MRTLKAVWLLFILAALIAGCRSTARPTVLPTSGPTASLPAASPSPTAQPSPLPSATPYAIPTTASVQPTIAPTLTPASLPAPAVVSNCTDAMIFLEDVTIPDYSELNPSQAFTKTWKVRNAGSCIWGSGYSLAFLSGEVMAGSQSASIPAVNPGDTVELSITMTAPASLGGYTSNWQVLDPRGQPVPLLGTDNPYFWTKVSVIAPVQVASAPTSPAPNAAPAPASPQPAIQPVSALANLPPGCASAADGAFEQAVLNLINQQRSSRGLPLLKRNSKLDAAALKHSLDMSCNNFVEHYGYDGSTWFTRITAAGYTYRYASENIAAGNPAFGGDAGWVVETRWMNSQVHRDNILNPQITEIGVSYVFNPAAQWGGYTTVDFALP